MFKLLVILYKTNLYAQLSPSKIELQDFIQRQKKEIKTIKQKVRRQQRKIDSLSGLLEEYHILSHISNVIQDTFYQYLCITYVDNFLTGVISNAATSIYKSFSLESCKP